jgi:hypothetical protein
VLLAPVELSGDGTRLSRLRVTPAGEDPAVTATGAVFLQQLRLDGTLAVEGATVFADDLDVRSAAGDGLVARCTAAASASLIARHVTAGSVRVSCSQPERAAELKVESSILTGPDPFVVLGTASARSAYSAHVADDGLAEPAAGRIEGDPQLDAGRHPAPGSPVVDAGDPAALAEGEPFEDADGVVRVADGDGDGAVRRDAGAYELQPPALGLPAGNVLVNPGAEDGLAGWSGSLSTVAFGDPFFLSTTAGAALGAGARSFAGGAEEAEPSSMQRIGVTDAARSIDAGAASARLTGLVGGYGADGDEVTVHAAFRDPEGRLLAPSLVIGPVTPQERGNASSLLRREAAGAIPPRTRAIDVVISGRRVAGSYTDAYADNLGLELSVPGVPVDPPDDPDGPVVPNLRPFAGVTVLHPDTRVTRKGTARVALACATATVRSCAGTLELRARLPRARAATRIARIASFTVAPGRRRGVVVKLLPAARRALRPRTAIRATLRAVAADGQGVQRTRTVPLRLRLPRHR